MGVLPIVSEINADFSRKSQNLSTTGAPGDGSSSRLSVQECEIVFPIKRVDDLIYRIGGVDCAFKCVEYSGYSIGGVASADLVAGIRGWIAAFVCLRNETNK